MKFGLSPSLNQHEMERLARIHRQNVQKHHAQQETAKHLQDIRRSQKIRDYEIEYNNLRAASVQGPLHVAAVKRLVELKSLLYNK